MSRNPPETKLLQEPSYRTIIGEQQWHRLHPAIRRRFSPQNYHKPVIYEGVMHTIKLSFAGKLLANLCRLIGTPLALYAGKNVPTTVRVYQNQALEGMTWDRFYQYKHKPVNRVKSTKCMHKNSGLVELVGFGFGMHLKLYEKYGALCFESTNFFWQAGDFRISIPDVLTPGRTVVIQKALDDKIFQFSLDVRHKFLGRVFYQVGTFQQSNT